jgi:hypothetical protein
MNIIIDYQLLLQQFENSVFIYVCVYNKIKKEIIHFNKEKINKYILKKIITLSLIVYFFMFSFERVLCSNIVLCW